MTDPVPMSDTVSPADDPVGDHNEPRTEGPYDRRELRSVPSLVLVSTGREMPQSVVDVADTVTEMVPVKHAFQHGIRARRGIDY